MLLVDDFCEVTDVERLTDDDEFLGYPLAVLRCLLLPLLEFRDDGPCDFLATLPMPLQ